MPLAFDDIDIGDTISFDGASEDIKIAGKCEGYLTAKNLIAANVVFISWRGLTEPVFMSELTKLNVKIVSKANKKQVGCICSIQQLSWGGCVCGAFLKEKGL